MYILIYIYICTVFSCRKSDLEMGAKTEFWMFGPESSRQALVENQSLDPAETLPSVADCFGTCFLGGTEAKNLPWLTFLTKGMTSDCYGKKDWQGLDYRHCDIPLPMTDPWDRNIYQAISPCSCGHVSYHVLGNNPYMEHLGYLSIGFIFGNLCQVDFSNKKQTRQALC